MTLDITLCSGEGCALRAGCLRHRLLAHGRQSWLASPPFDPATGRCAMWLPLAAHQPTEAQIRQRAYAIWLEEGRPTGRALEHWRRARRGLLEAWEARLRPLDQ
jgi:hypothetical protein